MAEGKSLTAFGFACAASAFAAISARYFYRSVAPPLEVYDNERMMLAFLYGFAGLLLSLGSLAFTRSAGPSRLVLLTRVAASSVIIYALVLFFYPTFRAS